jgi:hypothetical protein
MLPRVAYGNSHLICGTGFAPPWIFMNPQNVVHGDRGGRLALLLENTFQKI